MSSPPDLSPRVHDVCIVGGGNAGISLAAKLRRDSSLDVALVSPDGDHVYRPLLSYVGGGLASADRATRRERDYIPDVVQWYPRAARELRLGRSRAGEGNDARHQVLLDDGASIEADDLVLCPGSLIDWDAIPGSSSACHGPHGSTNYDPLLAPKTWQLLRGVRRGHVVFTVSYRTAPCPAVGLKPLFLAADRWRRRKVLDDIRISLICDADEPFGLAAVDARIRSALDDYGVESHFATEVRAVDSDRRLLTVSPVDVAAGSQRDLEYDVLHMVPPHRAAPWVMAAGLCSPGAPLVAVDEETLAHPDHPGLWVLGDVAALGTPSSGGGLRKQVPVVAANITARRLGGELQRYDGYTVAPVPLSRRSLLLGERNRAGEECRTIKWLDLGKPRAATLAFDLLLQPPVYWRRLLKGKV